MKLKVKTSKGKNFEIVVQPSNTVRNLIVLHLFFCVRVWVSILLLAFSLKTMTFAMKEQQPELSSVVYSIFFYSVHLFLSL